MSDDKQKMQIIRARVSKKLKAAVVKLAQMRGEAEAVLIREALREYVARNPPKAKRRSPIKLLPLAGANLLPLAAAAAQLSQ